MFQLGDMKGNKVAFSILESSSKKMDFLAEIRIFGPKKSHFFILTMF